MQKYSYKRTDTLTIVCNFSAILPALLLYDILLAFTFFFFFVKIKIYMKLKMQEYLEEIKFYSHPRNENKIWKQNAHRCKLADDMTRPDK